MIETESVAELKELLAEEIPCGGIVHKPIARTCNQSAVLMSRVHGCHVGHAFKCLLCWQIWYRWHIDVLIRFGHIRCLDCENRFPTIESFSDYRPF